MRKMILIAIISSILISTPVMAWVHPTPTPTTTTVIVYVFVHGGSHVAMSGVPMLIGMEVVTLAAFSPYLIMYYNHPECRKETSIGDMSACVQKGEKK